MGRSEEEEGWRGRGRMLQEEEVMEGDQEEKEDAGNKKKDGRERKT